VAAGSGNCSFNGVNDPFCGKSVADLVGKAIQLLLGAAGALFLAMFVYGGAVWLTAGSSDRHEQARKTLLNASAGIVVVILSYTMVNLLVKFLINWVEDKEIRGPCLLRQMRARRLPVQGAGWFACGGRRVGGRVAL
jgi:hypothetical protein